VKGTGLAQGGAVKEILPLFKTHIHHRTCKQPHTIIFSHGVTPVREAIVRAGWPM